MSFVPFDNKKFCYIILAKREGLALLELLEGWEWIFLGGGVGAVGTDWIFQGAADFLNVIVNS